MNRFKHLKEKALELRAKNWTLSQICKALNVNKTTAYYWIRHTKRITNSPLQKKCLQTASRVNKNNAKNARDKAYNSQFVIAEYALQNKSTRDFVICYMCEGYRKTRNTVKICNSNPSIVKLSYNWMIANTTNKLRINLTYYEDHDIQQLLSFWCNLLEVEKSSIHFRLKINAGKLKGRNMCSQYGLISIVTHDTVLRSKLQALIDVINADWLSMGVVK